MSFNLKSKLTEDKADPESAVQRVGRGPGDPRCGSANRSRCRRARSWRSWATLMIHAIQRHSNGFLELDGKPLLKLAPAADSRGEVWTLTYPHADQYDDAPTLFCWSPALMPMQKAKAG